MRNSFRKIFREYKEISLRYDRENQAIWCYFNPEPRPCFSIIMLKELRQMQQSIIDYFHPENILPEYPVCYFILASQSPGVFNFGGDLSLFIKFVPIISKKYLLNAYGVNEYIKS